MESTPEEVARHRAFLEDLQAGRVWPERPEAAVIAMSAEVAESLGEHLVSRRWQVYKAPPILVTCDEPVVTVGGPGSPRSERSGVSEAGVVMYPLCPSALLVMFHADMQPQPPAVLDHAETAEINKEIIASSSRWAFERPVRRVAAGLRIPHLRRSHSSEKGRCRRSTAPRVSCTGTLSRHVGPTIRRHHRGPSHGGGGDGRHTTTLVSTNCRPARRLRSKTAHGVYVLTNASRGDDCGARTPAAATSRPRRRSPPGFQQGRARRRDQ